jgi:hypothetical protein
MDGCGAFDPVGPLTFPGGGGRRTLSPSKSMENTLLACDWPVRNL